MTSEYQVWSTTASGPTHPTSANHDSTNVELTEFYEVDCGAAFMKVRRLAGGPIRRADVSSPRWLLGMGDFLLSSSVPLKGEIG